MYNDSDSAFSWGKLIFISVASVVAVIGGCAGIPQYSVYSQRLEGEAELAKAQYSKQVAVQEANAKMESAKLLAQAEVERAKGVAQANQIIGESLNNNEAYLRYLWINEVAGNNKGQTVVYVPTEANIPLMEAGHRPTGVK